MVPTATVLLVALTVLAGVLVVAFVASPTAAPSAPARATFAVEADAATDGIVLVHRGGDAVAPSRLDVRVTVDGTPLVHQPPVPFFAAEGFESGPTGPFNSRWDGAWTVGQRAGVRLAASNTDIPSGATVRVRVAIDGRRLAVVETRA